MRPRSILLLAPLVLLSASCDSPTCADYATCGATGPGDGGVTTPSGCDLTKAPKDSPACVDDSVGIFVDGASGADTNPGTKASPKKTVGAAVAATNGKPRVYVCQGTYAESVAIKTALSLYGGLSCGAFAYTGAQPTIQPTAGTDYALDISASNVTVSDLALLGPELGAPNSIAVRVVGATGVTFIGTRLEGRTGAPGADGTRTDFTGFPTQSDLNGIDASAGGGPRTVTCPGGATSTGGKGGAAGSDGAAGLPSLGGGGAGSVSACETSNTGGQAGAAAPDGKGGVGARSPGTMSNNAWTPTDGAAGLDGGPGQGGGGGGGYSGAGGGGGSGGCGGAGGGAGKGGGASVALNVIRSVVSLQSSNLVAGAAGTGGAGIAGQASQPIFGFGGGRTGGACLGGSGGKGGNGGGGGGAAGGVSVGYVFQGTKPTLDADVTVTHGTAGKKGIGGVPGTNDGVDGLAQDSYQAP